MSAVKRGMRMKVREMLDTRVPICKNCQGAINKTMVFWDTYKGHLFYCQDCGTTYKIVGQGQADNELLVEYERRK